MFVSIMLDYSYCTMYYTHEMIVRSLKYFSRVNAYWCIMKPIDGASIQNLNHVLKK